MEEPKFWKEAQKFEHDWHSERSNFANSYAEETKQYDYAHRMGLDPYKTDLYGALGWDFGDKTVLDVGGGGYSLLLKSKAKRRVVIDPCPMPNWILQRYKECGIEFINKPAETMVFKKPFDIVLSYNVLQHVIDPQEICKRMRKYSKTIHFFDWTEIGVSDGHPHDLHAKDLNKWLGGEGKEVAGVRGFFYSGVFKGDHYGK